MDGWGILAGALAGGAGSYIDHKLDEYEAQEAQIRKESEMRLREMLGRDRISYQDELSRKRIAYQDELARDRSKQSWLRGNSGAVDENGIPLTRAELEKLRQSGGKYLSREAWAQQHKPARQTELEQKYNFLVKVYGKERANEIMSAQLLGRGRGGVDHGQMLTNAKRQIDMFQKAGLPTSGTTLREMVLQDPEYQAYIKQQEEEAKGAGWNPFDNKDPQILPPEQWAYKNRPNWYSAAATSEKLLGLFTGNDSLAGQKQNDAGKGEAFSVKQGNVTLTDNDIVRSARKIMEMPEEDQKKALALVARRSGKQNAEAIVRVIAAFKKIPKKERRGIFEKMMKEGVTLGDVMESVTKGGVAGAKTAYHIVDKAGKKLSESEQALLRLNNKVGQGILGLGSYAKDRFKEAYLPQ